MKNFKYFPVKKKKKLKISNRLNQIITFTNDLYSYRAVILIFILFYVLKERIKIFYLLTRY